MLEERFRRKEFILMMSISKSYGLEEGEESEPPNIEVMGLLTVPKYTV
jgi:hypothetical protein